MAFLPTNDQNHHQFHAPQEEENFLDIDGSEVAMEKKRRLSMDQVNALERNFEVGRKLDHEKKMELSKALGLQPKQVAIWFQNRRARWKTKKLQNDYDLLKKQLHLLNSHNQSLLSLNHKLQSEVLALEGGELINLNKETNQGCSSDTAEKNSDINLDISTRTPKTTTMEENNGRRIFFPTSSSSPIINSRFDLSVKEESFNNMFSVVDDHTGFWPWIDQRNFN